MVYQYEKRIKVDPKIMVGKPIIKGTRITVELILRLMAQGMTEKQILDNYTHLKKQDIKAVLEYALHTVEEERVLPLVPPRVHRYA